MDGYSKKNLAKAWVHISEDRIKNNNQQLDVFWELVLDAFHEFCQEDGERVERTVSSLKYHWSDMNRACKVYGTCLKSVMQGPISGIQQGNLNDASKTMYEARGKGKWSYKDAYEVLSAQQCWKIFHLDRMEKKKEEYVAERDKKKEESDPRIMELRERKIKAVVNLKAQFQAQNDQKVMAMDMSTLGDTQRIY
ncbi:hypothetical protein GIB67_022160 [Kingdonia uniflora]|uniref:No apical meristem-associated C-terminal domain-containing protein n=1 Tax=Kingdonia uniflora TaxID=39325 RepID=A0A7J7N8W6_9MAGN|nr:hypothetical protein GIB67_022160 [Kingdonia uniflora]